ncbi:hypothetical protein PHYNN_65 [Pantoea phage Phynn]|nr:hypothetical protein PHYNN_65 [Pantoea phage Phynn]
MTKKTLNLIDIKDYSVKVGSIKRGVFEKEDTADLKAPGFYLVVDDKTGRVPFRFYVAPNQRQKQGARRTILRITRREHEPSAMVALLESASFYFVEHDKIKNLFGLHNLSGSMFESAIQLKFEASNNYSDWNRALNDMYDFEFQPY